MKPTPKRTPSGKRAAGHAVLKIHVWFTKRDASESETAIEAPEGLPYPYVAVAAEALVRAAAVHSTDGFEKALELIVQGALAHRGLPARPRKKKKG